MSDRLRPFFQKGNLNLKKDRALYCCAASLRGMGATLFIVALGMLSPRWTQAEEPNQTTEAGASSEGADSAIQTPPPDAPKVQAPAPVEAGDYEIDYEEEPDAESGEEAEATPTPTKKGKTKSVPRTTGPIDRNIPSSQGTRSKNKFAPLLKSETKSIYKKNGRPLDVDTD